MSLFYLIRHGEHDWLKKGIAGRIAGVSLNANGRAQADALVKRLEGVKFGAIYTSPMERALETAEPLARARGLKAIVAAEMTELDFGEWNGVTTGEVECGPALGAVESGAECDADSWRRGDVGGAESCGDFFDAVACGKCAGEFCFV